jgi:hypothetical protein
VLASETVNPEPWALGALVVFSWGFVACAPAPRVNEPTRSGATPADPPSGAPASPSTPEVPASKVHPQGGLCGGIAGFACAPGLYCSFPPEAMCGAADQTGTCTTVPEMCTQEFSPVCGCNDKTYPNACHAAREGISVEKKGECAANPASAPVR